MSENRDQPDADDDSDGTSNVGVVVTISVNGEPISQVERTSTVQDSAITLVQSVEEALRAAQAFVRTQYPTAT